MDELSCIVEARRVAMDALVEAERHAYAQQVRATLDGQRAADRRDEIAQSRPSGGAELGPARNAPDGLPPLWPRARRTVSQALTIMTVATPRGSGGARSNCSNAKATV
jgi:hypothetical protein